MVARAGRPLSDVAYDELKYKIIRAILPPGQWLSEKTVAEELALSLTPVRVALARLSSEGLLITLPRRGYRVSALTLKSVDDLFAIWKLLAAEIMRLATLNMTPEALAGYHEIARQMRERTSDGDGDDGRDAVDRWLDSGRQVWQFFARLAANEYLEDMYLRLDTPLSRVFALTFSESLEVGFGERRQKTMTRIYLARDADAAVAETIRFVDIAHREARRRLTSPAGSSLVEIAI